MDRQQVAYVSLCCEAATLALTLIYCAIVAHDLSVGPDKRVSSPSWFQNGFCESWKESYANSHMLCFFGGIVGGMLLLMVNLIQQHRQPQAKLGLAIVISIFNALHGLAHGGIALIGGLDSEFLEHFRPSIAPLHVSLLCFSTLFLFLGIGPFIGHLHGMSFGSCIAIHIPSMLAFMMYVPLQFAFGAVQLVLNIWICVPRLLLVGCIEEDDICSRVEHGWPLISTGVLLLMPFVFAEMILCDKLVKDLSGHFLYDCATLLLSVAYSSNIWKTASGNRVQVGKEKTT